MFENGYNLGKICNLVLYNLGSRYQSIAPPKWATAEYDVPGALLHNITAEDTRERPLNVSFEKYVVPTGRVVVPTGRVISPGRIPTGRYVVPTGRVVVPTGRVISPGRIPTDKVMSDLDESGVTYTDISSPFEELSDIGSPRADDHEHLMLPEMLEDPYVEVALQAPPSLDYIHGPEEPEQAPPSADYVPGLEHVDDEIVAEDQPYIEDTYCPVT
nr:hypothetical protein [Tanacetum cinerariifolium]